jgi:nicotinate-nucleotide adenylyltransferase
MTTYAVFGGSFNPPHVAHQMACLLVLETEEVDAVLVVPTFRHPFDKQLCPYEHRLEMARLAMAPLGDRATVSDIERSLGGEASLTLHTLEALAAAHPGASLRLVIGSDILREREKWYRWDAIERLAPCIVVARAGFPVEGSPVELPAISSTDVRARLARGESGLPLVPRAVSAYIRAHGLYQ